MGLINGILWVPLTNQWDNDEKGRRMPLCLSHGITSSEYSIMKSPHWLQYSRIEQNSRNYPNSFLMAFHFQCGTITFGYLLEVMANVQVLLPCLVTVGRGVWGQRKGGQEIECPGFRKGAKSIWADLWTNMLVPEPVLTYVNVAAGAFAFL